MLPSLVGGKMPTFTSGYLVANLVISLVAAIQGGLITGRLAPSDPFRHGCGLAIMALLCMVAMQSAGVTTGLPRWYLPVVGVVGVCGALLGGKIQERRLKSA